MISDHPAFGRPLIMMVRVSVPANRFLEQGSNINPSYLSVLVNRQQPYNDCGLRHLVRDTWSQHKNFLT